MTKRDEMIEKNLGLVHSCARKFTNRGVDYDDLFQAGCVGLLKAVDGFNESLGFNFSTYAVPAILGEIKRIFRDGGAVKISRTIKEQARELYKQKEQFENELGYEPSVLELAEYTGLNIYETSQLLLVNQPVISLTLFEEDAERQYDIPVDGEEEKLAERISLDRCLSELCDNDKEIISLRYYKAQTQSAVAKKMGMTQVQVSRREKKILKEIRRKMTV